MSSSGKSLLLHPPNGKAKFVLVIHGGAGTILREGSTPEQQAEYKQALRKALEEGHKVLSNGGQALDAAVAAVEVMENSPLFNAGKGAVFNIAGKIELEASVMLSKPPTSHSDIPANRRGVSVTLLTRAKNPCKLVRALYLSQEQNPHPFVSGSTAEDIGVSLGETLLDPSYFYTERRWREHRRGLGLPEEPLPYPPEPEKKPLADLPKGTVGAVALDVHGCIVALTSTGGRTNKLVGRIGDTPHMGAGFWAEEWQSTSWVQKVLNIITRRPTAIGVSGTGDGDFFIRQATASTMARRVQFKNQSLKKAGQRVVEDLLKDGGIGGIIALDSRGNVAMPMNSSGMYRGVIGEDGVPKTAIFADEEVA